MFSLLKQVVTIIALAKGVPLYNYPEPNHVFLDSFNGGSQSTFTSSRHGSLSTTGSAYATHERFNEGIHVGGNDDGVLVQKHIYFHVAPEDPEEMKQGQIITPVATTKHYKIIFIKPPLQPLYTSPIIQAQAQNREKTLIYVLIKKPHEQQDVTIKTAEALPPSKPEVYFIRYKANTEATGTRTTTQTVGVSKYINLNHNEGCCGNIGVRTGITKSLHSTENGSTRNFEETTESDSIIVDRPSTLYGPQGYNSPH